MEKRLRIYAGPDHPREAQFPKGVEMLPKVPRKRSGEFHFGLKKYSETPYQINAAKGVLDDSI